jgi:hypothetical protein
VDGRRGLISRHINDEPVSMDLPGTPLVRTHAAAASHERDYLSLYAKAGVFSG